MYPRDSKSSFGEQANPRWQFSDEYLFKNCLFWNFFDSVVPK